MTLFDEIMEAYQNFDIVSKAYIEKLKEEFENGKTFTKVQKSGNY